LTAAVLLPTAPARESLPPNGLSRLAIARCDNATPGNSAWFGSADAEAGTHVCASSEGRSPNTGGAAEASRTDPDNIDSTA
jgi:hypothetical protein